MVDGEIMQRLRPIGSRFVQKVCKAASSARVPIKIQNNGKEETYGPKKSEMTTEESGGTGKNQKTQVRSWRDGKTIQNYVPEI